MTPAQRFKELCLKGFCFQCLFPGAMKSEGRHADSSCQTDFICKHSAHDKYPRKKHILVCQDHCELEENFRKVQIKIYSSSKKSRRIFKRY